MNINGTTFHDETPAAVAEALERARATGERVRFWLGDPETGKDLSLIHISEPTRLLSISYAVFCLKKKKKATTRNKNEG